MNAQPDEQRAVQVGQTMAGILKAPRFALASFDNYTPKTKAQTAALATARRFVSLMPWWDDEITCNALLLLGPPGTGKTHLAAAVLRAQVADDIDDAQANDYLFIGHAELLREWRAAVRARTEADYLKRYAEPLIVVIDDVRQPRNADDVDGFEELVEARYRRGCRPVVLTSNLNLPLLQQAIGDRAFDRLREGALLAVLDDASHRARYGWDGPPKADEIDA